MAKSRLSYLIHNGLTAIEEGNTLMALLFFQDAAVLARTPTIVSSLGFCLASEQGQIQRGLSYCREALQKEPANALHYLNLGRVYLLAGQKRLAIQSFRKGLKFERQQGIVAEMRKLGLRQEPFFSSLRRENLLNRYLGLVCTRIGMR